MKKNKSGLYIDNNYFLENINESLFSLNPDIYSLDTGDGGVERTNKKDPIRYLSKNFWTNQNNTIINAEVSTEKSFSVEKHANNVVLLKAKKNVFRAINKEGLLEDYFSVDEWKKLTTSFDDIYGSTFSDYSFKIEELVNLAEEKSLENNGNFLNRECIYNFYSNKYDSLMTDRVLDVRTLPDVLSLLSDRKFDYRSFEENLNLSYAGLISDRLVNFILTKNETSSEILEYYNTLAEIYHSADMEIVKIRLMNNNKNKILTKNIIKNLKEASYFPFPAYFDVKFSNKSKNKDNFIHFLSEMPDALNEMLSYINRPEINSLDSEYVYEKDIIEKKNIKTYDLKSWLRNGFSDAVSLETDEQLFFNEAYRPYRQIDYSKIVDYIKKHIKSKHRSYFDLNKPKEDNQILLYKIEKKQFSEDSTVLQTFWITPDDGDFFRFVDSQIKYGNEYYYSIKAYVLNIGTEYVYSNYYTDDLEKLYDLQNGLFKINVATNPSYKICEIEIGKFSGSVYETPPTKPKISFTNIDSIIKIHLFDAKNEEYEEYKVIEDEDFSMLEGVRLSQDNESSDKIVFKKMSNEEAELEIYKTTIKPINYLSFQGKKYRTIKLNGISVLDDRILPEVKYYYTFRYLNKHGCPSNPTLVYELELKDEEGYYYLNIKTIDLDAPRPTKKFKELKRYLLLRPSIIQLKTKIPETINSLNDVSLGPDGHNIWSSHDKKQFIMRITSKKTNRVIEFDVGALINRKKS